jgi:hypothetical protein
MSSDTSVKQRRHHKFRAGVIVTSVLIASTGVVVGAGFRAIAKIAEIDSYN